MGEPLLDLLSEVARYSPYPVAQFVETMDMMRRHGLFIVADNHAVVHGEVYRVTNPMVVSTSDDVMQRSWLRPDLIPVDHDAANAGEIPSS